MKCNRCLNEDPYYFYNDNGIYYCRKCINFGRIDVGKRVKNIEYKKSKHHIKYQLEYPLTSSQKNISDSLAKNIDKYKRQLVYAACGAGKTEIVFEVIADALRKGKKVGFAISRRQVVIEIKERLSQIFKDIEVICVCEGYTTKVDGDLIVCTMHQLYRYHHTFDLLIMDEIDGSCPKLIKV